MTRSCRQRTAVVILAAALLAGCGTDTAREPRASATVGGDEPLTGRALAAVVADHVGAPSSAVVSQEMGDVGTSVAAEVELRYPVPDSTDDGDSLTVGVGTGFEKQVEGCASLRSDQGYAGCARTADGIVFWEKAAPEEDPGVVYVMVSKAETDVLLFYSGPTITGDPRTLDLPVPVRDLFAIGRDSRVDVTTSPEAVAQGERITYWKGDQG